MALGVIARLRIKPGLNLAFEAAFLEYQQTVRAKEPGNLFFVLHRSRSDACTYTVLEQYASKDALSLHVNADYYRAIPETFGEFMAAPPDIEYLDAVESRPAVA